MDRERILKVMDEVELLSAYEAEGVDLDVTWNQDTWATRSRECGTTMCFAGLTCRQAGDEFVWHPVPGTEGRKHFGRVRPAGSEREVDVRDRAQQLLGLNDLEAQLIFGCPDNLTFLRAAVGGVLAGGEE